MKSFVYVISGDHGRQKIGSSNDPRRRIKELQTGSPFPLRFEFVGETDDRGAGAVEVQAHFMLHEHKASGGDEWFTIPPDVAITAVMAAAHRIGYRVKPIDPDSIANARFEFGVTKKYPLWVNLSMIPFGILYLYWIFGVADPAVNNGKMTLATLAIECAFLFLMLMLLRIIIHHVGAHLIEVWQGLFAKPQQRESWFKVDPS